MCIKDRQTDRRGNKWSVIKHDLSYHSLLATGDISKGLRPLKKIKQSGVSDLTKNLTKNKNKPD